MTDKRFVIATDPMTPDQETALRASLGTIGFWHWLPNFWLIQTSDQSVTAENLRDKIRLAAPLARCFVTQVIPVAPWAGAFKPDDQGRDMGEWLRTQWDK